MNQPEPNQRSDSFWANLWARRVPQIVGVYIAAWWVGVEISQWLSENVGLSETFARIFALAMLIMLPALVVVAYGHGAPGRDRWTGFQLSFVGVNAIVAGLFIAYQMLGTETEPLAVAPPAQPTSLAAPEIKQAAIRMVPVTMDGEEMEFAVATEGYHRRLIGFFWRNETGSEADDWLSYGLPWLLARDLRRSPLISTALPYDSQRIRETLTKAGIEQARDVPRALAIQIATDNNYSYAINGRFRRNEQGQLQFSVSIIDADGERVGEPIEETGDDPMTMLDSVAVLVRERIGANPEAGAASIRDLPIRDHTADAMASIEQLIEAKNAIAFDNDYGQAKQQLKNAVDTDPTFADAHTELMMAHQLSGEMADAIVAGNSALRHDYKLYSEDKYTIQATLFGIQGDRDRMMQTLVLLTDIHPNSVAAHRMLAANAMVESDLDLAAESAETILALDPAEKRELLRLANIEIMRGNLDAAAAIQQSYLADNESDLRAVLALATTQIRRGELDQAAQLYNRATLLDSRDLSGDLGLAKIDVRTGHHEEARQRLERIFDRAETAQQKVDALGGRLLLYNATGELRKLIETAEQMDELSAAFQAPIFRAFSYGFTVADAYARLGEFESAEQRLVELKSELQPPLDTYVEYGYMGLAELKGDQERYQQALDTVAKFNEVYQNPVNETFLLQGNAQLAIWAGDFAKSASIYTEAIDSLTKNIVNLNAVESLEDYELRLARCMRMAGRYEQSYERLQSLLKRFPASPTARLELAELFVDQDDADSATEQLQQALSVWDNADNGYAELRRALDIKERLGNSAG